MTKLRVAKKLGTSKLRAMSFRAARLVVRRDDPRRYMDSLWRKTLRPDVQEKLRGLEPLGTVHVHAR